MPKIGLSQHHKKYLEIFPFSKKAIPCAVLLYTQAKSFYKVFRLSFGNGSKIILDIPIPKTDNLGVCLINYHFAIELTR
ncbi:MAG: hypothetical protein KR126chlam5_00557 [Candidatus Anoxychlamydiales bacterium]|nr:hypothetical protein [Candidatus Anoxychlamydiales bacterium]